jgi:CheY-like chemotaxis protein
MNDKSPMMRAREKVRVLVLDDDELAREFLSDILRSEGFSVMDSESIIGVTNKIIREDIHVVVLDVMMPTIRGDRLAALLRKNSVLGALGVVLVSSHPREELDALITEVGALGVVGKHEARLKLAEAVMDAARSRKATS